MITISDKLPLTKAIIQHTSDEQLLDLVALLGVTNHKDAIDFRVYQELIAHVRDNIGVDALPDVHASVHISDVASAVQSDSDDVNEVTWVDVVVGGINFEDRKS